MDSAAKQRRGLPATPLRALLAMSLLAGSAAFGQRIQIPPSSAYDAAPAWGSPAVTAPASGYGVPAPTFNAYTAGQVSSPMYSAPVGAPPANALPYSYAPPVSQAPVAPAYSYNAPPGSPGFSTEQSPLGWQSGTYGYESNDGAVTRYRQLVARLRFEHTLLMGDNTVDSFGMNRSEIASTFALPVGGSIETPLLVTPGFAFNWLDGPESDPTADPRGPDQPARVYDAYLDFAYNPRWTPEFGAELGFRTGVWSDFKRFDEDSLRLLGRGLGVVSVTPQFELLAGAVYLDRLRVKLLPAGGIRWRPAPEWDLYLVFPNPKIRRTWFSTSTADWWIYLAGEYGGGSWTVDRPGLDDRTDYNDIRAVLGLEWQTPTQATGHLEIGYVFDREFRFDSGQPGRFKLDDAVMFRAGIGF